MAEILIADDDPSNLALMQFILERQGGHQVRTAHSAFRALELLQHGDPDLLVVDVVMPGMTGLDLCRQLRRGGALPILIVSGKGEAGDRVAGLRSGADDYLPKPFDPAELLERVNALLRRARHARMDSHGSTISVGDLRLQLIDRLLWVRDRGPIALTPAECRLLYLFLSRPEWLWTREELVKQLWTAGALYTAGVSALESQIARLRAKIERTPHRPAYLVTVRGRGYRLLPCAVS